MKNLLVLVLVLVLDLSAVAVTMSLGSGTTVLWSAPTTNWWTQSGDEVQFRAAGRNLSVPGVSSNQMELFVDTNIVFLGPYCAGAGAAWNLAGSVQWDGTNFYYHSQFNTGDTNFPTQFDAGLITNAAPGVNQWTWGTIGDVTNLTFDSATLVASRSPFPGVGQLVFPPAGGAGGRMNFDAGNITSDGLGNIVAFTLKSELLDNAAASGTTGEVPTANGDGTWNWQPPTGGAGITNFVFTSSGLPAGSAPTSMVVGVTNNIGYAVLGIPAGSNGLAGPAGTNTITNTISYYNLSNNVVSAAAFTLLNTNFNFDYSNSLGKFTNVARVNVTAPQADGISVVTTVVGTFYSTTGSNGWTQSPPPAPNLVWLAVTSSVAGAGNVIVTGINNPNAQGNTNDLTLETTYVPTAYDPRSPVPLTQLQTMLAGVATFQSSGTNYYFSANSQRIIEVWAPAVFFSTNISLVIDATGTNYALSIAASNLVAGAHLVMSTNIALPAGGFQLFNSYTAATNSGIVTFTMPISKTPGFCAFFQVAAFSLGAVATDYALTVPYLVLQANTVSHSTNSTFGYGAGLMTCDTNWIYLSVAINQWRRVSIPTNTW